jgi:hypothetical protein
VAERGNYRRQNARLLCSLLASTVLNVFAWTVVTWNAHISPNAAPEEEQARETLRVSVASIRVERRSLQRHQPKSLSSRSYVAPVVSPVPSLSLPSNWTKQDTGNEGMLNVSLWLDWTKQTAEFVPRVFLWQRQMTDPEGRRATLQDAVNDVLSTIHSEGDRLYASNPERVCDGTRRGWFLSYDKPEDQPPIHIDDTLFVVDDTVYRATYVRPASQPEDEKARAALDSLCAQP